MPKKKPVMLFVCTGNTCRSPMALIIAQEMLGDDYICKSAGSNVTKSDFSFKVNVSLKNLRFENVKDTKTVRISQELLDEADMVFCLGTNVLEAVNKKFPSSAKKVFKYAPNRYKVPDPLDMQGFHYSEVGELLKISNCKDGHDLQGSQVSYDFVAKMMRDVFMPQVKIKIENHFRNLKSINLTGIHLLKPKDMQDSKL